MALSIRRGASRAFKITLEGCEEQDYIWKDLGSIRVRLSQGGIHVDKTPVIDKSDGTVILVYFSQEDTIKFLDTAKAKLQVFTLKESTYHQLAIKSDVFEVAVLESLWDDVVTDGSYSGNENIDLDDPEYSDPIGHDYYGYLHMDVEEFRGIISEVPGAIMEGTVLRYNPSSETLLSSNS